MYIWIGIIILLFIAEVMSVNLTTIWYVVSGLVALCISLFCDSFIIQFAVFVILGTVLLITTKPLLKKYLKVEPVKTNFDRVIGMEGIVTEKISKFEIGEVKVDGKKWSAICSETIEVGSRVIVLEIEGVKLKVKKVEE